MIENYLRYNEITRNVLELLRSDKYDHEKIEQELRERQLLFSEFEQTGWPHAGEAEPIIRDTLKLEHECISMLATKRRVLQKKLNSIKTKKHALNKYIAHTL